VPTSSQPILSYGNFINYIYITTIGHSSYMLPEEDTNVRDNPSTTMETGEIERNTSTIS
jgi:hypothetical protein